MTASIPFNYIPTTNAPGTFNVSSTGYVQGGFVADPAIRYQLAGGILSPNETLPMFGGVAISENVTPQGINNTVPFTISSSSLGGYISRSSTLAGTTGISVFNQAYGMAITPQSPVPLAPSYGQVNFFRLGSNARIIVACAPSLISLEGGLITQQVSWDYGASELVPYVAAYPANVITAAAWANTNGGQATLTTTSAHGLSVGSVFDITGITPAAYNGTGLVALTGTTGSTIVYALPAASTPGSGTAFGTLVAGGGAFPCKVLQIEANNSMVVTPNALGGYSWNYQGTVAMIQI